MEKTFKLRHANEVAGTFVIVSMLLLVAGIFVASNKQGWFEGKFELMASFNAESGAFGLREGSDVIIMNTLAGRVDEITPTADGNMQISLIIKESFRQFVSDDSVARVKKKFVAAGDSYLEIDSGKGRAITDGSFIKIVKDEEIMDTAQAVLADVQEVVLPMVEEVQEMLVHMNAILTSLDAGEGTAGTLINDTDLAKDMKSVVRNSDVLLVDTQETMRETTRMIKAAQKTWLLRKHVESDESEGAKLSPHYFSDKTVSIIEKEAEAGLREARSQNNPHSIARNALNSGYIQLLNSNYDEALLLIDEARRELVSVGDAAVSADILHADLLSRSGNKSAALGLLLSSKNKLKKSEWELNVQCLLMAAELCCDMGRAGEAFKHIDSSKYFEKKLSTKSVSASSAMLRGRIKSLEGYHKEAASVFDDEVKLRRDAGQYKAMVHALLSAGSAYESSSLYEQSADRYYRAGRSLIASGDMEGAKMSLDKALSSAQKGDDVYVAKQAEMLLSSLLSD